MILDLNAPGARDLAVDAIGGKAHGLAAMFALGLPVPPALVVPVSADGELDEDPIEVVGRLGGGPVAVRSSAVGEDTGTRSAAGQFESVMGVTAQGLVEAVRWVRGSASSARVRMYAGEASPIAVVIQREVPAARAGVAFSRDPVSGSDDAVVECVFGHGEALVSGTVTPDRYRITPGGVVAARIAGREGTRRRLRTLRDDEVVRIVELTRRAADGLGRAVDVEFCFERRMLWLVQARAITA